MVEEGRARDDSKALDLLLGLNLNSNARLALFAEHGECWIVINIHHTVDKISEGKTPLEAVQNVKRKLEGGKT